jgi:hypothetical protein
MYNSLLAVALELTKPLNLVHMENEFNFSPNRFVLGAEGSPFKARINGIIDQILTFSNGHYIVRDYKTGWITSDYRKRQKLVEDIQMTIYDHVTARLKEGRHAKALYIQPLEFSSAFLKAHGPDTLKQVRIQVEERNSGHLFDLNRLVTDIMAMAEMVVFSDKYSEKERRSWEPLSMFGKKAGFSQCVAQARFIPRIGAWCDTCSYVDLCRTDHPADWEEYLSRTASDDPKTQDREQDNLPFYPVPKPESTSPTLFDPGKPRSPSRTKTQRQKRKELLATGKFLGKAQLKGSAITKARQLLASLHECDCISLGLTPLWLLESLANLKAGASIKELAKQCPYHGCPRKT